MPKTPTFYPNTDDDLRCMLACYRSLIDFYFGETMSWDELDSITGFKHGVAAWSLPSLLYMHDRGLSIKMIEPFDYERYLNEGLPYLDVAFKPEERKWQLEHTNIRTIQKDIPLFLKKIDFECSMPSLDNVDSMLDEGRLVTIVLNSRALNGKDGYNAHMVLVYARDEQTYTLHDPGLPPQESRTVTRAALWKAMGEGKLATDVTGFKKEDNYAS